MHPDALFLRFVALFTAAVCLAGPADVPQYRFGEMWWEEYAADRDTDLLLHFGPPTPTSRQRLAAVVRQRQQEEDLLESALEKKTTSASLPIPRQELTDPFAIPLPDESALPPGTIADYSPKQRVIPLAPGWSVIDNGRFGHGVQTSGGAPLQVEVSSPMAAETWTLIESFPQQEACILSLGRDESRLILRPDGRIELRLRKPRGIPSPQRMTPEVIAWYDANPPEPMLSDPIPTGTWVHISVSLVIHAAPGGSGTWETILRINGAPVARYRSESGNRYEPFGGSRSEIAIANSTDRTMGFHGRLDEIRVSRTTRDYYERIPIPWRDSEGRRPLAFDRPWFRSDCTVLHASFDHGLNLDLDRAQAGPIALNLKNETLDGLKVEGIRGTGWVMDPDIGFARIPLKGITAREGTLEFWLRPQNWDDCTGYWHHSPPPRKDLSVTRIYSANPDGSSSLLFSITLPRAYNLERSRIPLDPGRWLHLCFTWNESHTILAINGKEYERRRRPDSQNRSAELTFAEFGVPDDVSVIRGERPRIEIDEAVAYRRMLRGDEIVQAMKRWMGPLEPIPLYEARYQYKWSIRRLEFNLTPLLPEDQSPLAAEVVLKRVSDGQIMRGPFRSESLKGTAYRFILNDGEPLPYENYRFEFHILDTNSQRAAEGAQNWRFETEPWRECRAGILPTVPPPWTPLRVEGNRIESRMSTWVLGPDGLPAEIWADGVNLLAGAVRFLENGTPMQGLITDQPHGNDKAVEWTARFEGRTADLTLRCLTEYDGMVRHEIRLLPKASEVAPIQMVIPVKSLLATHWLVYPVGQRGPQTGLFPKDQGLLLTSRADPASYQDWRRFQEQQKNSPDLTWEAWWRSEREQRERWGFYTHLDLNDRNRGLWWFCDNAAGWVQSKKKGAIEMVRNGEAVELHLNLIAEPAKYSWERPIVFGFLPHPARPMPDKYRLFEKGTVRDPVVGDVFDAFFPWPVALRDNSMHVFPAADPRLPEAGPSWEYVERMAPLLKSCKPLGLRTMYLSKAWLGCRTGAYDNWEWRSGEHSAVYLTPWFVNYLSWEMNEWVGRKIWDAIYLDECYEHPARNVEAGASILLPDGIEQPGVSNFAFRELMKRWRNIFHQHGRDPFLIAHLTYSWQYQGVVFCDAYLDGENRPIVSLNSRDWIDSTSKTQFEVVQNSRLWGVASFYMPYIAEGGFEDKSLNRYPRWQWRMARQAQSQFAHYETATVYEGQGSRVYKAFWNDLLDWGAGDAAKVSFHPYWDNREAITVEGQGEDSLVSFYRKPGGILLVASNRRREPVTMTIQLHLDHLGLPPHPKVRSLDSSFEPPPGADYVPTELKKELAQIQDALDDRVLGKPGETASLDVLLDEKGQLLLEDPDQKKTQERAAWEPRLEAGNKLILPVRAKDFRMITLE